MRVARKAEVLGADHLRIWERSCPSALGRLAGRTHVSVLLLGWRHHCFSLFTFNQGWARDSHPKLLNMFGTENEKGRETRPSCGLFAQQFNASLQIALWRLLYAFRPSRTRQL